MQVIFFTLNHIKILVLWETKKMTEREEDMMNTLWSNGSPMTSVDLEERMDKKNWNHAAIFRVIKSLLSKGLIEECGTELRSKQWTRKFRPMVSKEEYMAQYLMERGINSSTLGLVTAALVEKSHGSVEDDEKLIDELEAIINRIRERGKGADK